MKKCKSIGEFFEVWGSLIIFASMVILFSVLSPNFRSITNISNVLVQSVPTFIMALGMCFVNLSGESDMSMGGTVGLAASVFCGLVGTGHSLVYAVVITLGISIFFGALNGVLVAKMGLSSFITTISVMFLTQGLEYTYTKGDSMWTRGHPVTEFIQSKVGIVPVVVIIGIIFFVISYIVIHQTRVGSHLQAVGLSAEAAKYAGIPVAKYKFFAYIFSAIFFAVGGVIYALHSSGAMIYSGQRALLPVLAVTFIAKTVLGTKRPNIPGILVGALMLTVISSAFTLLNIDFYYISIAQGAVLIFAAILSVNNRKVILQEDMN